MVTREIFNMWSSGEFRPVSNKTDACTEEAWTGFTRKYEDENVKMDDGNKYW